MKIKIKADSTCDLTPELLREFDVDVLPIHILLGEQTFADGVNCTPEKIFDYVAQTGGRYSTASANPVEYFAFFQRFAGEYDAVIHISVGAALSSCCQNAVLGASELDNVHVIDSKNVCTGQGYLVLRAAMLARQGADAETICRELEDLRERVELSFVLDQLEYLFRSGRCPAILALGSNLLQIRPCLECVDGQLKLVRKYRGHMDKCVEQYVRERLADRDDLDRSLIFISSCVPAAGCLEAERQAVVTYGPFDRCCETLIGSTIGSHSGPGAIGVVVARKK